MKSEVFDQSLQDHLQLKVPCSRCQSAVSTSIIFDRPHLKNTFFCAYYLKMKNRNYLNDNMSNDAVKGSVILETVITLDNGTGVPEKNSEGPDQTVPRNSLIRVCTVVYSAI